MSVNLFSSDGLLCGFSGPTVEGRVRIRYHEDEEVENGRDVEIRLVLYDIHLITGFLFSLLSASL